MELTRIDQLATTLAATRTRRGALGLLIGSASALLGASASATRDRTRSVRAHQFRCVKSGKTIVVKKNSLRPVPRCCDSWRKVSRTRRLCCKPDGAKCSSSIQCCNGACNGGVCQELREPAIRVGDVYSGPVPYGGTCNTSEECMPTLDGHPVPCSGGLCRFP